MTILMAFIGLALRRSRPATLSRLAVAAASACVLALAATAQAQVQTQAQTPAQGWPQRSVKFILPFGAGSATDVAARLIGERLSAKWGKPIVVENRPGADGLVAINAFLAANDDHVLLYASSASFIAHPYMHEKLPYVLERDLAPIARVADTILAVGVPAASGIKTIAEFVQRARAEPQKYNVAGAAGLPEFAVTAFLKSENLAATKVPYRDVVQAGRDLGENRIQLLLSSYAVVRPLVEAGKVTVVAVGGRERTRLVDAPTVTEAGYPGLQMETTSGFYGPKGMPLALRQRIGADVIEAASEPSVSARIAASGQTMRTEGPAELASALKDQAATAARIAAILGMEMKK
jgi:tripartite-type tricarboxylate transporter receptor subunit TctC